MSLSLIRTITASFVVALGMLVPQVGFAASAYTVVLDPENAALNTIILYEGQELEVQLTVKDELGATGFVIADTPSSELWPEDTTLDADTSSILALNASGAALVPAVHTFALTADTGDESPTELTLRVQVYPATSPSFNPAEDITPSTGTTLQGEQTISFTSPDGFRLYELGLDIYGPGAGATTDTWNYDAGTDRVDITLAADHAAITAEYNNKPAYIDGYGLKEVAYDASSHTWSFTIDFDNDFWTEGEWDFLVEIVDDRFLEYDTASTDYPKGYPRPQGPESPGWTGANDYNKYSDKQIVASFFVEKTPAPQPPRRSSGSRSSSSAAPTPAPAVPTAPTPTPTAPAFTQNLSTGSTGDEVTRLQQVLINQGFLVIDAPTGYFGPQTAAALVLFQSANGIDPLGIVGPATRAALNANVTPTVPTTVAQLTLLVNLLTQLQELQQRLEALR